MKARHLRRRDQAGFILLDAMAAFGVLAIGLGMMLAGIALAARTDVHEAEIRSATRLARSLVDQLGESIPLEPSEIEGDTWRIETRPLSHEETSSTDIRAARRPLEPFVTLVTVQVASGGALTFQAVKLARAPDLAKAPK